MKKYLSRFFAVILILATLISFAACTEVPEDTDENKENNANNENNDGSCEHSYKASVTKEAMPLADGVKTFVCDRCAHSYNETIPMTRSLKVLAIGNSFSSDAVEYLFDMCKEAGVTDLTVGNLYIPGCTLDTHYKNVSGDLAKYEYYKNTDGKWIKTPDTKVSDAIADEKWDVITLQQASGSSGLPGTYSNLPGLIDYVKRNCPDAKIYWHMTWAYQQNSTHGEFSKYEKSQQKMYSSIVNSVKTAVLPKKDIVGVIPSGTAIQNLRGSFVGDTVTRDGYHMSYDVGRYTVALTWFSTLTGASPESLDWTPAKYGSILKVYIKPIRESVTNAVNEPYAATPSKFGKFS